MNYCRQLILFLVVAVLLLNVSITQAGDDNTNDAGNEETETTNEIEQLKKKTSKSIEEVQNAVVELTDENFDHFINDNALSIILFYAKWCEYCKRMQPDYEEAAKLFYIQDDPIPFGSIDGDQYKSISKRFDLSRYPTMKVFKNGAVHDFDGGHTVDSIVRHLVQFKDPNFQISEYKVATLSADNFTNYVNNRPLVLVNFCDENNSECKRIKIHFRKAAERLLDHKPTIDLAQVDVSQCKSLGQEYEIEKVPTLKVFRHGRSTYDYNGPKDEYAIVTYMREQIGPSAKEINSTTDIDKLIDDREDVIVVGYFQDHQDPLLQAYIDAGNDELRIHFQLFYTANKDVLLEKKIPRSCIIIYQDKRYSSTFEQILPTYESKHKRPEAKDIKKWIKYNTVPLLGELSSNKELFLYSSRLPLVFVFMTIDWNFPDDIQFWRRKILPVVHQYKKKGLVFVLANEEDHKNKIKLFQMEESGEDINIGIKANDGLYKMEGEFTVDALRKFLDNFLKKKVKRLIRSQLIPRFNDGPVTILVGRNLEAVLTDPDKDVLIYLYAPWCSHCKEFTKIYEKFAEQFQDYEDLVIAKIDATANDILPTLDTSSVPVVYFYPKKDKLDIIKYKGFKTVDGLSSFIKKHSTVLHLEKTTGVLRDEL